MSHRLNQEWDVRWNPWSLLVNHLDHKSTYKLILPTWICSYFVVSNCSCRSQSWGWSGICDSRTINNQWITLFVIEVLSASCEWRGILTGEMVRTFSQKVSNVCMRSRIATSGQLEIFRTARNFCGCAEGHVCRQIQTEILFCGIAL